MLLLLLGLNLTLAVAQPTTLRQPDVRFVATPQSVVEQMLELANVKPGDVVYDLGCGDGRVVITAAKHYGVRAVGIEKISLRRFVPISAEGRGPVAAALIVS